MEPIYDEAETRRMLLDRMDSLSGALNRLADALGKLADTQRRTTNQLDHLGQLLQTGATK